MRRFLTGFAVTATVAAIATLASASNQDVADQVAQSLRGSGQMSGYKIGVKCQNGTVWLRGTVANEEQMNTALKLTFHTPGVARVVNELSIGSAMADRSAPREASRPSPQPDEDQPSTPPTTGAIRNPLRGPGAIPLAQTQRRPQNNGSHQPHKDGILKRMETTFMGPRDSKPVARAERVPSSYRAAPVVQTSAQLEMPEPMAPQPMAPQQRAKPMATRYVAMQQQQAVRGPGAPNGRPLPMYSAAGGGGGVAPARYDQPCLPNYAWPSYAAYPNYAAVTYPKQYSPTAWPYIGPFYPYPQVPLGWRKVSLEWEDGWWFLDFKDQPTSCWHR